MTNKYLEKISGLLKMPKLPSLTGPGIPRKPPMQKTNIIAAAMKKRNVLTNPGGVGLHV